MNLFDTLQDTPMRPIKITDFYFNNWIREKLPPSSEGTTASDIDFIIHDYKKRKLCMVEIKKGGKKIGYAQKSLYSLLNRWMTFAAPKDGYDYTGFYFIQFEHNTFSDGKVLCNGKIINEANCIKLLTFNKETIEYYATK